MAIYARIYPIRRNGEVTSSKSSLRIGVGIFFFFFFPPPTTVTVAFLYEKATPGGWKRLKPG